jgi:hypothetical protein
MDGHGRRPCGSRFRTRYMAGLLLHRTDWERPQWCGGWRRQEAEKEGKTVGVGVQRRMGDARVVAMARRRPRRRGGGRRGGRRAGGSGSFSAAAAAST